VRVGSIEPSGQPSAQSNGGHIEGNLNAQNPAYRQASHFLGLCNRHEKTRPRARFVGEIKRLLAC
jgi:hypothetical protein